MGKFAECLHDTAGAAGPERVADLTAGHSRTGGDLAMVSDVPDNSGC